MESITNEALCQLELATRQVVRSHLALLNGKEPFRCEVDGSTKKQPLLDNIYTLHRAIFSLTQASPKERSIFKKILWHLESLPKYDEQLARFLSAATVAAELALLPPPSSRLQPVSNTQSGSGSTNTANNTTDEAGDNAAVGDDTTIKRERSPALDERLTKRRKSPQDSNLEASHKAEPRWLPREVQTNVEHTHPLTRTFLPWHNDATPIVAVRLSYAPSGHVMLKLICPDSTTPVEECEQSAMVWKGYANGEKCLVQVNEDGEIVEADERLKFDCVSHLFRCVARANDVLIEVTPRDVESAQPLSQSTRPEITIDLAYELIAERYGFAPKRRTSGVGPSVPGSGSPAV